MSNQTSLGRTMTGGKLIGARGRQENDFYPTPPEPVVALLGAEIDRMNWISSTIWEPCCGDGAIARMLEYDGFDVIGTDIAPRGYGAAFDFLAADELLAPVIVTNPPYIGGLPEKMLLHAFDLGAGYVAFLLKTTYWSSKRGLRLWRRCRPTVVYGLTWRVDFLGLGKPTMDVSWNVWVKGNTLPAIYDLLPRPKLNDGQQALWDIP